MPVLLIILIPLGALVIYAVAYDLRRRRRGDRTSHDISSAARLARTNTEAMVPAASARAPTLAGLAGPVSGAAPASDGPRVSRARAGLTWVNGVSPVLFVYVRTLRCALCDDNGAAVVH
jgi:hypothetical protein